VEALSVLIAKVIKNNKWFLLSLFIFSFLLRAFIFQFYLSKNNNYWQVDSNTYHRVAASIAQNKGVSVNNRPNFYRLPGYSYFLSVYYKVFGEDTKNVLWLQVFLASFIPILIFLLAFLLVFGNVLVARISSIYASIHLGLVLYSGFFMTESLFLFFLLLFLIFYFQDLHLFFCKRFEISYTFPFCPSEICSGPGFVELEEKIEEEKIARKFKRLFFAGLFLGLSSLVRPVGHYLIFLSILILFFSRNSFKDKIKKSLTLFGGWILVVGPWLLRNYLLLGQIFFHTLPGGHFLHFSAARNVMHEKNYNFEQSKDYLRVQVAQLAKSRSRKIGRNLNEIELCDLRLNLAVKYFKKYPLLTLKHWLTDILRTSLSLYSAEILYLENGRKTIDYFSDKRTIWSLFKRYLIPQTKNVYLIALVYIEIILFTLMLLGLFAGFILALIYLFCFKANSYACLFFKIMSFILLFLVIGLAGGYARMRLPAEPLMIILGVSFYIYIFNLKRLKKNGFA
jgi:hypothetical protein